MVFPVSVADEIKSRLDIVAYIQQYVPLKKSGRTYKACCPWHSEKTPSFVVSEDRQTFRCFGACATGGDIFAFAMRHHGWSFSEALQELGRLAGVEVHKQTPEQKARGEQMDALRGLLKTAAEAYHQALINPQSDDARAALHYAKHKRGFSDETLLKFGIGYAPPGWHNMLEHLKEIGYSEDQIIEAGIAVKNEKGNVYDRFRSRLMIPIRDERGRVIGFGARALDPDDNPKYLNSPQTPLFDKSRTLFALDVARNNIHETETAVIVEGYVDAITAHQAGFTNVVAQMGTAMTDTQLKTLTRSAKKIILALDSDAAGQNATRRSLEVAQAALQADYTGRLSVDMRVLQIPGAKDPDDLIRESPEKWAALVAEAQPVADYVIETEIAGLPPDASPRDVESLARRLIPTLLASENNVYNKENVQKLLLALVKLKQQRRALRSLSIGEQDLLDWANEQQRIAGSKPPRSTPPDAAPPEPPPPDYEALMPPDNWDEEAAEPQPPAPQAAALDREAEAERRCLRLLFHNPDLYYVVNRKLRELAGSSRALRDGPLRDWEADDFAQPEYRALMQVFQAALAQDEQEVMDFMQQRLDSTLLLWLEAIMIDELEENRARLRHAFLTDLNNLWDSSQRRGAIFDHQAELLEKVLRLRGRRLHREREELCLLQTDSQIEGDEAAGLRYGQQVVLSQQAKQLIDSELGRHTGILRK
ncbi:MAG: DNA primase [Chloroflexi bacterium]|nr:DNA primase [Chloroflexota bacterium]MDL1882443.1 DNA primase [Anaerolineae bacterium CFX8]